MEEKGGKVGAKWVQMSAADQEKGEKVQEKTGEVGGVRQKVGKNKKTVRTVLSEYASYYCLGEPPCFSVSQ